MKGGCGDADGGKYIPFNTDRKFHFQFGGWQNLEGAGSNLTKQRRLMPPLTIPGQFFFQGKRVGGPGIFYRRRQIGGVCPFINCGLGSLLLSVIHILLSTRLPFIICKTILFVPITHPSPPLWLFRYLTIAPLKLISPRRQRHYIWLQRYSYLHCECDRIQLKNKKKVII